MATSASQEVIPEGTGSIRPGPLWVLVVTPVTGHRPEAAVKPYTATVPVCHRKSWLPSALPTPTILHARVGVMADIVSPPAFRISTPFTRCSHSTRQLRWTLIQLLPSSTVADGLSVNSG